jgi:hypothetical protein
LGLRLVLDSQVDTLNNHPTFFWQHTNDFADFAFIISADDHHSIAFSNLYLHRYTPITWLQNFRCQ